MSNRSNIPDSGKKLFEIVWTVGEKYKPSHPIYKYVERLQVEYGKYIRKEPSEYGKLFTINEALNMIKTTPADQNM